MKTSQRYVLYLSIPLLLIIAFVGYRAMIGSVGSSHVKVEKEKGRHRGEESKSLPVSVYIATLQHSDEGLLSPGSLASNDKVEVASEQTGRVISINFKEGQFVKRGAILVRLNDDELQSQLTRAKYQYKLLQEKLQRQKILLDKEAVSREDYDQVSTEFNVLKQDMDLLEIKIEKMKIRAPFN